MKVLIAVCVVVLLLQSAVLGLSFGNGGDEPSPDEIEEGWDPGKKVPVAASFEGLLDPFRPRLRLHLVPTSICERSNSEVTWPPPWEEKSFAAGRTEQVCFENGHEDRRVAEFELTGGDGVLIRYPCDIDGKGYKCPQVACLCSPGACSGFPAGGNGCRADGNVAEIVVYSEKGTLEFTGLGDDGGTVRQR